MPEHPFRCGFIAVAGRPNVGKSTLVNALVGHKVSIVTPKPQTTRQRVLGIHTTTEAQFVFVDTPGLHTDGKRILNRQMNRTASHALEEADVVLLVVEALLWTEEDAQALTRCTALRRPLGLVVNKIDKLKSRGALLAYLDEVQAKADFKFIVPVAAERGENLPAVEQQLLTLLPVSPPLFPSGQVTDQGETVRAAEFVREQLMRLLAQELPYAIAVQVDEFKREGKLLRIGAIIWVEREGQKAIVIGSKGQLLKTVGRAARLELQQEFGCKIFLRLWVKVRPDWTDDEQALRMLGLHGL